MTKTPRILVVEDEETICKSLESFFKKEGFQTEIAFLATLAMHILTEQHIDICLTDINLPDYDATEWIPKMAYLYPKLQWILYTSRLHYILPEVFLEIGIKPNHVFYKPLLSLNDIKKLVLSF